jgi:hypothetical protein
MTTLTNRELVNRACEQVHDGLLPIIEPAMRTKHGVKSGDWVRPTWERMSRNGGPPPQGPDLQFLLKCIFGNWQSFQYLGNAARAQATLLMDARNGLLAHNTQGSADVTTSDAREVITHALRLLERLKAPQAAVVATTLEELAKREARERIPEVSAATVEPSLAPSPDVDQAAEPPSAGEVPSQQPLADDDNLCAATRPSNGAGIAKPALRPLPYPGKEPSNMSKDAKYGCRLDGRIKLEFDLGDGDETLLTTDEHPELVEMVKMVKGHFGEPLGGVFYVNEYGHVLVKAAGETWYAGEYHRLLEFEFEGRLIGPRPEEGAKTGDPWRGPHVGIRYTLTPDGRNVYFKRPVRKGVLRKELLSSYADASVVTSLARLVKQQGGRLYINEARVLFTPVTKEGKVSYVYLGTVAPEHWFPAPAVAA